MPIRNYKCENCEHTFEDITQIGDTRDLLIDCPECKEPKLKIVLGASSFILKGDGFYKQGFDGCKSKK